MKCGKCGSENTEKKDNGAWVCKDCWHVMRETSSHTYTYPLDPYPLDKKAKQGGY